MNNTNGKITLQSKERIVKALFAIMKQYDFREITVTQITQEADLSRITFYRLFKDKDEVMQFYFRDLFNECMQIIKALEAPGYWEVVQAFFDFWEERKNLLQLLKKNHLLSDLFDFSYNNSMEVFSYVRANEMDSLSQLPLAYLLAYSVGGMHSMLLKWVENDMDVPSSLLIEKLKIGFHSDHI